MLLLCFSPTSPNQYINEDVHFASEKLQQLTMDQALAQTTLQSFKYKDV